MSGGHDGLSPEEQDPADPRSLDPGPLAPDAADTSAAENLPQPPDPAEAGPEPPQEDARHPPDVTELDRPTSPFLGEQRSTRRPEGSPSPPAPPEVQLDRMMADVLGRYLAGFRQERGGVLLGRRAGSLVLVGGAVFPPQLAGTQDYCAFDARVVDLLGHILGGLADEPDGPIVGSIVGWVHTHPGLGLFLSDTDVGTLANWTDLDAQAIAIVVDPHSREQPFGAWGRGAAPRRLRYRSSPLAPLGFEDASRLATHIRDESPPGGSWQVIGSDGVTSVYP